jgi:RNA polymerase sigma-70 factor, ECF subfamily
MVKENAPADGQIVQRVLAGQHEDFALLVQRHLPTVHALAYAQTSNYADAEDIVQETFLKAYTSLDTLRQAGKFRAWIATIARNTAYSLLRPRKRHAETPHMPEPARDPEVEAREIRTLLRGQIDKLDEPHREVLLLHYFAGLTTQEVGATLEISKAAAQKRLQRARDTLGKTLVGKLDIEPAPPAAKEARVARIMGLVLAAPVSWKVATAAAAGGLAVKTVGGVAIGSTAKMLIAGLAIVALLGFGTWHTLRSQSETSEADAAGAAAAGQTHGETLAHENDQPGADTIAPNARLAATGTPASTDTPPSSSTDAAAPLTGGIIRGRVYDAKTGKGIEGVSFSAMSQQERHSMGRPQKSDASGNYVISGLADCTYALWVRPPAKYMRQKERRIVTATQDTPLEDIDFALEPGIRVAGKTVDREGNRVAGASVIAQQGLYGPHLPRGTSQSDGAFEIYFPAPCNDLYLAARSEGSESLAIGPLRLPAEGLSGLKVPLTQPRTAHISGVVVDTAGRPLKDMTVLPWREGILDYLSGPRQDSQKCTANGAFTINALAAGDYELLVLQPGNKPFSREDSVTSVKLAEGQQMTGLRLVYGAVSGLTISGRVVDTAGKPIEDADVSCAGPKRGNTRSGKDGAFSISGLTEGVYRVVQASHHGHTMKLVHNIPARATDMEIVMLGLASVEGKVVRADNGEPVVDFELFYCAGSVGPSSPSALSNGQKIHHINGHFKRDGLWAGKGTVTVQAPGFVPSGENLVFAEHETVSNILLRLEKCAAFTGTVVNTEGAPVADALIYFDRISDSFTREHDVIARSDSNGAFTIESFHPSARHIAAYHPDYAPGVGPATPGTQVVLPPVTKLKGVVYEDGKPLPNMDVSASFIPAAGVPHTHTVTDEHGTYELSDLTPGTAQITVRGIDQVGRQTSRTLTFEAGATAVVDFHFSPASSQIEGTVSEAGEPVEKATVHLRVVTTEDEETKYIWTGATGSYRFDNLPAGEVLLRVDKRSADGTLHVRNVRVDLPDDTVLTQDIDFTGEASLQALIKGFSSNLYGGVMLLASDVPLPETLTLDFLRANFEYVVCSGECRPNGSILLEGLEAGDYVAVATTIHLAERNNPDLMRFATSPIRLIDGKITTVEFDFR